MGRTKQSDAPSGTFGNGDLRRWLQGARTELGAAGISATFGEAPRSGGAPGATWVSMSTAGAHGRLIRAADGSTKLTVHRLPDSTPLLDERHPHTTLAQLEALVDAMRAAPRPPAGRA
jgi:hypothetical protein